MACSVFQVHDLLDNSSLNTNLDIRQNPEGGTYVPGLKQVAVTSLVDVMNVLAQGSANRATALTNLNDQSSRSHLILSVMVTTTMGDGASTKGKLNLVDLAGSEKVSKSGVTGTAMKEAQHINKSLAALGDVLEALDQKSKHVPYRLMWAYSYLMHVNYVTPFLYWHCQKFQAYVPATRLSVGVVANDDDHNSLSLRATCR